jgi:hypothetical protein
MKWHSFNFRISWQRDQAAKWWVDILILDCVVRPVVSDGMLHGELWRVHRRAANDSSGHEFTFDCFTTSDTAKGIDAAIQAGRTFSFLRSQGLLVEPNGYCMKEEARTVSSISLQTWPAGLREAWPLYINGVCRAFLQLVESQKTTVLDFPNIDAPDVDAQSIERSYQDLNRQLNDVWRDHGGDAFLHQMNAVFAYQPLWVGPKVHGLFLSF